MRRPCRPRRPSGVWWCTDACRHRASRRYLRGANKRIPIAGRHTLLHTPLLKVDAEAIRHPPTISIRRVTWLGIFCRVFEVLLGLFLLFFSFFFFLVSRAGNDKEGIDKGEISLDCVLVERMKFFFWNGEGLLDRFYYIGDIILLGDLTRYVRHVS